MNWHDSVGGGGAIDLVMHLNHLDFKAAVDWLAHHFPGVLPPPPVPPTPQSQLRLPPPDPSKLGRVKEYPTFFDKLPTNWWMMFLMWPAPIFAVLNLAHLGFTQCLAHPEDLSTTPLRALAIMAVTFAVGFFYATILLGNSEPQTLVSRAGLRTELIRFYEWEKIHHISKRGDLYSIYHVVNPALPATSFKLRDRESQATLERYISMHQVPVANDNYAFFTRIKARVILGFLLNLLFAFWLRFNTPLLAVWIVLISFGIGIVLTLFLERIRGVSKFSKFMPIIEGPAESGIGEHLSSPP